MKRSVVLRTKIYSGEGGGTLHPEAGAREPLAVKHFEHNLAKKKEKANKPWNKISL
jgi:hypothetical protein